MVNGTPAVWSLSPYDTLRRFKTSERGLSAEDVRERKKIEGLNEIAEDEKRHAWQIFADQFRSPLVLLLIGASLIAFALGERTETILILIMTSLGAILGFVQEYRSEVAVRMLRKKLSRKANVIRNGESHRIDARDLVPGDIVELELGNIVPADLRLIAIQDLETDESTLTGESKPVPKSADAIEHSKKMPQEQWNMAFLGAHVVQGSGIGVVVAIGRNTEMGRTAKLLAERAGETSFQRGVREFGNFLLKITIGMAVVVAVMLGLLRGNWGEAALFALALAVGLSPELLPVIVTLNLSRGARAMSKKHVLVKRLIAIEDLGDADVICMDKTGTLTEGTLRVRGSVDPDGAASPTPLALAAHCLDINPKGKATNPVDAAILAATKEKKMTLVDLIAFDFTRRRMSCVVGNDHGIRWLIAKGAAREMLDVCTSRVMKNGQMSRHLTTEDRERIRSMTEEMNRHGVRLIAVARRQIGNQVAYTPKDECNLELVGFIRVSDAPKETAKAALVALRNLHVRVVVVTGDVPEIAQHVANQLEFSVTGVLTGEELERMEADELLRAVEKTNVFARITPEHKLRIVKALQAAGHRVGFLGDGVNDAPALHAADVGISFDAAVGVAKEAASVILLQKNLSVLADGIREGRRTFVNTQNYIRTTISSNFGNMLSVAGAALLLPFIPFLPAQILLLNLLGDIPMLAISTDRVPEEEIAFPKKWDIRQISNFMYFFGSISSLADYATFGFLLFVAHANAALFRSSWFIESLLTQVIVIFLLRTRRLTRSNSPGLALIGGAAISILAAFIIVQTRIGSFFHFVPVTRNLLGAIALIVLGYAFLTEMGKRAYLRFWENTPQPS